MALAIPPQSQDHQPGVEKVMRPLAVHIRPDYKGSGKLEGKKRLLREVIVALGVQQRFILRGKELMSLFSTWMSMKMPKKL